MIVLIFNALVAATLFKTKKYKILRFFKSCEVLTKLVDRLREAGGRAQQIRRLQLVGKIRMKRQKDTKRQIQRKDNDGWQMINVRAEQMESCITMEKGQFYLFGLQSMAPAVEFLFHCMRMSKSHGQCKNN